MQWTHYDAEAGEVEVVVEPTAYGSSAEFRAAFVASMKASPPNTLAASE